jgi:hypothetical protein
MIGEDHSIKKKKIITIFTIFRLKKAAEGAIRVQPKSIG